VPKLGGNPLMRYLLAATAIAFKLAVFGQALATFGLS
jgi:hypothetical protein